ncbi:hypothetical protein [Marinifilum caeruleilacunae]|uniref:Uncharacterized protein n=1 Tax=Marinifilum caeruleilacunae TaxID=2499076 RepID=A0ABX1WX20_9BACT|nr:hypothetical protein [Marinifilum caeruleilacunae]NOU60675.1 hypothetical protein [Marinifilum caeruleilacunae]
MWKLVRVFVFLILLIPVISWIVWKMEKDIPINLLVIDKTTPEKNFSEHLSFFWLANQNKWVKSTGEEYDFAEDFLGFHPDKDGEYVIKDLKIYGEGSSERLADSLDVVFFADTYGIYNSNWKDHPDYGKDTISLFYGGLQANEFNLLRELKRKGKTIIAEFNLFASPTSSVIRRQTEELLGVKWTGWVGKYYSTLDTVLDPEIPKWIPDLYEKNYKEKYNFKKGGIVLVDNRERIIILEDKTHLNDKFPILRSELSTQLEYNVPEKVYYPYWFDINSTDERNHVLANFEIDVNADGRKLMDSLKVPSQFPAIIEHDKDYRFLYFACDFSDNPMGIYSSYFRGIETISGAFYSPNQVKDRKMFFWKYYRPFMETVMDSISAKQERKKKYLD